MRLDPETRRRSIIPLLAGALIVAYLFVFLPVDRKADALAEPLQNSWEELAEALGRTNVFELDFIGITNQLQLTRTAVATFEQARQQARERVELDDRLRVLLDEPFLLVHYQYEAGSRIDALTRLAKQQKVKLEPGVLTDFPEHSFDMQQPALLWAQLAFLDSLLTTAINAGVNVIHSIDAPPPTTGPLLSELPLELEFTGPVMNVAQFLQTVPLRSEEIEAAGLPASPSNKPALFIDRLVLRKQSPDKPDEVRVALRVVGFVFHR